MQPAPMDAAASARLAANVVAVSNESYGYAVGLTQALLDGEHVSQRLAGVLYV